MLCRAGGAITGRGRKGSGTRRNSPAAGGAARMASKIIKKIVGAWRRPRSQVAALPFRWNEAGQLSVFLVTSRDTHRWIVPKGWPIRGLKPHEAAAREAYEEAGLEGHASKRSLGRYTYEKRLDQGVVPCEVDVYPLEVKRQMKRFPERGQREGRWMAPEEAASLVQESDLADLIRRAPEALRPRKPIEA